MGKVQVLISTYNGEKYIKQQLTSVLEQSYPNTTVLIRDDGSQDETTSIIHRMKTDKNNVQLIEGQNIGVIESFTELLKLSDACSSYYCFCDQDDVWMEGKIERAVNQLKNRDVPSMYFSSTQLVDRDLNALKVWPNAPARNPSFLNALVQNVAVGATIVFNKAARDLLLSRQMDTSELLMHDWWVYTCISAFGHVIYDPEPTMYYRQHGENVVGGDNHILQKWKKKWGSFRKHSGQKLLRKQAVEFSKLYGEQLNPEYRAQLELFIKPRKNILERWNYLKKTKLYRQSWTENQLFKFLILIDYI